MSFVGVQHFHVEIFEGCTWEMQVAAKSETEAIEIAERLIEQGGWHDDDLAVDIVRPNDPFGWRESSSERAVPWCFDVPVPCGYRRSRYPEDGLTSGRLER